MSTPAGWYPDPTNRHQNRWFDGDDWTDQVADGQAVGVDPVHGAGTPDVATTQAVPTAQPAPPPGAPGAPGAAPAAPPGPGAGTPTPGAPLGGYTAPDTGTGGGNRTLLIVGAVVVAVAVVLGLVVALGGGDDSGDTAGSDSVDQSDAPEETTPEDPSVSDLFDDMADSADQGGGDVFGSGDEPADTPADTTADGGYPPEVIANFTSSCTGAGSPASFCGCVIDELQANVSYDRFIEIDQQLAENPGALPSELTDAAAACQ